MNLSRRNLMAGAAALTFVGPGVKAAFGATGATSDILIVLFQRGACDWLQMLSPAGDANYVKARPSIRVATTGTNAGIGLGTLDGTDLYLSNSAPELKAIYDTGDLAFIHATGLLTNDRSHFLCQYNMEKGQADADPKVNTGWLTRHIASVGENPGLSTVSSSASNPASLLGDTHPVAIGNTSSFNVYEPAINNQVIRNLNAGSSAYKNVANATLDTIATIQNGLKTIDSTAASAAGYTGGSLSSSLRSVGQLIRMNLGLSVATVDYGSWDMHNSLVGEFRSRTTEFSKALSAFWTDMADYRSRITLVTMTEFGRRLQENASQGTDHGSASGMMVLSGNVNGGKIYGTWPGLAANQLNSGDLAVTTDYRQVLAEIITTRHGEKNLASVFPSVKYAPIGFMKTSAG